MTKDQHANQTINAHDTSLWLTGDLDSNTISLICRNTMTGRPIGSEEFIKAFESLTGRVLSPMKRGRKKKGKDDA